MSCSVDMVEMYSPMRGRCGLDCPDNGEPARRAKDGPAPPEPRRGGDERVDVAPGRDGDRGTEWRGELMLEAGKVERTGR
jgi:hypothetical protein